jgi:hypothetical protein
VGGDFTVTWGGWVAASDIAEAFERSVTGLSATLSK